ncbi:DUF6339 family protein [Streptomyces bugieae]|uniref:DUF6339 family protein n=1 Tax=Streptomyces bugieae TaxID=3098223 RepID=A0ABU7P021_9ACTN|nr:DUF6339 family protein [Streptomyces sp. DSM 41528]
MSDIGIEVPDRLGLLPTAVARRHLTRSVLSGRSEPPVVALLRASESIPEDLARWNGAPVRELFEEAMNRFAGRQTQADSWLAPRLHATLRMTRAEAADPALWNFLALLVVPDYVVWRWGRAVSGTPETPAPVQAVRFVGRSDSQAVARLWWAAELFRDGEDYRPAEIACGNQDMLNTALRLDAVDHRPTALAIVRVLESLESEGLTRLGDRMNALCSAVNSAGSTLMYEVLAPDELPDAVALHGWIREAEWASPAPWDRLPDGPPDGTVPTKSIDVLTELFTKFQAEAPLRARGRRATGAGPDRKAVSVGL